MGKIIKLLANFIAICMNYFKIGFYLTFMFFYLQMKKRHQLLRLLLLIILWQFTLLELNSSDCAIVAEFKPI
jgi:hypothetical protein